MGKRTFVLGGVLASSAIVASFFAGAIGAGATETATRVAATIGVDHASPVGKIFEYNDFFPRGGSLVAPSGATPLATRVHNGDVVEFKWNPASVDGFHTATLLKNGETPPQAWAANPFVIPDEAPETGLVANFAVFAPRPDPTCGHDAAHACAYSGSNEVNSGASANADTPTPDYFVKIQLPDEPDPSQTVNFVCLIHPGMAGSLEVVAKDLPVSTQAELDARAQAQHLQSTAAGLAAEAIANHAAVATNSEGTHTITMTAGTAGSHVEVLEMLPNTVNIQPGDKVKWVTTTRQDPHTVTFPKGHGSDSVDPFQRPTCETGATDTPPANPAGPPTFGCVDAAPELPFAPQPQGETSIDKATTVGSSGIISTFGPFPDNFTFSFPKSGTFNYQCRIHDHMVGTVVVAAPPAPAPAATAAPQLAQTGGGRPAGAPVAPLALVLGGLVGLLGLGLLGWRRFGWIGR